MKKVGLFIAGFNIGIAYASAAAECGVTWDATGRILMGALAIVLIMAFA